MNLPFKCLLSMDGIEAFKKGVFFLFYLEFSFDKFIVPTFLHLFKT